MRFPEFSGDWIESKLGDIADFSKGAGISKDQRSEKGNPCILYGELYTRYKSEVITNVFSKTALPDSDLVKSIANDIIIPASGETAEDIATARCVPFDNILLGGDLNIIRLHEQDGKFFSYQLNGVRKYDIATVAQGVSVVHLHAGDLKGITVKYPSHIAEQEKISQILGLIDDRIATQSKIIEELTTLRSALYDSMFCSPGQEMPKFRIQSFSGKWQLCQLNEICSRKSIKNKDNLYSRVLTIAAQHGLVDQESFFKKRIASENLESYLCLEKGDFAYNKSYSSDYPWGAVKRLSNFDKGIISPLYICFTPKPEVIDPDYLAHYFESTKWHSGISEISGEGARNHGLLNMSVIDYFNTCHRIPGLDEQKAIARRLNAIAHKLQTEQEYLELLNRQKDCFLKQMFI